MISTLLKRHVLILVYLLCTIRLFSQTFVLQSGTPFQQVINGAVALGDYDNDGDLDVILTGANTGGPGYISKIYRNNGNSTFTEQTSISLPGVVGGALAWGDYNNDNYLDLLLTGYSDTGPISKIFKNGGDNSFTEQPGIVLNGISYGSVDWGDYDNDGYLDIIIGSRIYHNNGDNTFSEKTGINLAPMQGGSVAWGDYNNDGYLDILLTGYQTTRVNDNMGSISYDFSKIYKNNGDGTFSLQTGIILPSVFKSSVAWGDYDTDGDLDILLGGATEYMWPYKEITKIFRNNGNNSFTEQTSIPLTGIMNGSVGWGDYDNDGILDAFVGSKIYHNNGTNSFTLLTGTDLTGDGLVSSGDFNNDGTLDILAGSYLYRNISTGSNNKPSAPTNLHSQTTTGSIVLKWDKANDTETPQNGLNYNLYVYENGQTNYRVTPQAFRVPDINNGRRLISERALIQWSETGYSLKDLPSDKDYYWSVQAVDAGSAGGSFSNEVSFTVQLNKPAYQASYLSLSNIQAASVKVKWMKGGGAKRVVFIRENTSGVADLADNTSYNVNDLTPNGWKCIYNGTSDSVSVTGLIPKNNYFIHVCEYNGNPGFEKYNLSEEYRNPVTINTTFIEQVSVSLRGMDKSSVAWGDYNNDGYFDILMSGKTSTDQNICKVYKNNGGIGFTDQTDIIINGSGPVAWGDYDNDSDLDILVGSQIFRNNGGNIFIEQTSIGIASITVSSSSWGDYDKDGDLDIALTGSTSSGYVSKIYRNNGDNTFTEDTNIPLTGVTNGSVDWGDYNNDGSLDLLITGLNNFGKKISGIYKNNGNGSFSWQTSITLTGVQNSSTMWGDFDLDGDLDIILTGNSETGNISKIYRNNGDNSFSEQTNIQLKGVSNGSATWGDYDNDGFLDILLTGNSGSGAITDIYHNDGNNSFSNQKDYTFNQVTDGAGIWGDFDNDGDPDIILTGFDGNLYEVSKIYRNEILNPNLKPSQPTGLQSFWENDHLVFRWNRASDDNSSPEALKYNLRVGTTPGGNEVKSSQSLSSGKILVQGINNLFNDTSVVLKLPLKKYYWSVQTIDISGEASSFASEETTPIDSVQAKNLQAFIKTPNSMLIRWENGNGKRRIMFCRFSSAPEFAEPVNGISYHAEPYFANGDKIVSSGWFCMYNGIADSTVIYGLSENYSYDIQVIEYTEVNGLPVYFKTIGNANPGVFSSSLFSEQTGITLPVMQGGPIAWCDYDQDRVLDISFSGVNLAGYSDFKIAHNNNNNSFTEQPGISVAGGASFAWGDYDNDGDMDVVAISDGTLTTKIFRNNGNNTFTEQTGISLPGISSGSVEWGDYDNDSDLDLLISGLSYSSGQNYIPLELTRIYRNNGDNTFSEQTGIVLPGIQNSSVAWGDYDNDGDLDILMSGFTNPTYPTYIPITVSKIFRNNGNNTFSETTGTSFTVRGKAAWVDYDNDGDLDVSIGSRIYRNEGEIAFIEQKTILLPDVSEGFTAWGDYDSDGDPDILLSGSSNSGLISKIYRNNGNNTFTEQTDILLTGLAASSGIWGDYDNDGDLDIIITGYSSNYTSKIYRNNKIMKAGNFPDNNKPLAPENLHSIMKPNQITLSWSPVKTDETSFKALTYNVSVGTNKAAPNICTPHSSMTSGLRSILSIGNAQMDTTFYLKGLSSGTYYWKVQSVDQGYQGGNWSVLDSFNIKTVQTFFAFDTVCKGFTTNFTDQSVAADGIKSWFWDFNDGQKSTLQNPQHIYASAGIFKVKLVVVSNTNEKDSLTQDVVIKAKPIPGFTAAPVCIGSSTTLINTTDLKGLSISKWYWSFGDGQTSVIQSPETHTYVLPNKYSLKLKVESTNGCSDSIIREIIVAPYPNAAVSANGALTFCRGDSVKLYVPSQDDCSYQWTSDNINIEGANTNSYTIKNSSALYRSVITNTKAGCISTSDQLQVTIKDIPTSPSIVATGSLSFCVGDSVTLSVTNIAGCNYQWKLNGGAIGTNSNQFVAKTAGTYSLLVTNSSGCSTNSTNTINVVVNSNPTIPTVNLSGPTSFCEGASLELSVANISGYTYQWENNGSGISGAQANTYSAKSNGVYSLKISNSNNCFSKTENVTVSVFPTPVAQLISATALTTFCQGDSVILSVPNTTEYNYQWKLNGGSIGLNSNQLIAKNAGTYTVVVSNSSGCSAVSLNSISVTVNEPPKVSSVSLSGSTAFCDGDSLIMSVQQTTGYTYQWLNASGPLTGKTQNRFAVKTGGQYSLKIYSEKGCQVSSPHINVTVKTIPALPKIIAENYISGKCNIESPITLRVDQPVAAYTYQWKRNGVPLDQSNMNYLQGFLTMGEYTIEVNNDGCKNESKSQPIIFENALEKPLIFAQGPSVWYLACSNDSAFSYKWYYNGNEISGANKFLYVANRTLGNYYVSVGNEKGCFTASDVIKIPTGSVGIDDINPFSGLKIYPNPTPGLFTIEMDNNLFGELMIRISNSGGREILNIKFEKTTEHFQSQIDLSGQGKGMYLINMMLEKYMANRKLIVE